MTFTARFPGRCFDCDRYLWPGDTIGYEDDTVVCEACLAGDDRPRRTETVCTSCWLVQPCDCETA